MSKRIETSIIINKPLDTVWQEVKVMENHVNWMEDAVKIDILSGREEASLLRNFQVSLMKIYTQNTEMFRNGR